MFLNLYPNFTDGRILKKEMLQNLRDYPRNFIDNSFKAYSNGILSGVDILGGENCLTITKGIVKYKDRIYVLESEEQIPCYATEREILIKIRFLDKAVNSSFKLYGTEIFLDWDRSVKRDELELGRFKLREGARLRSEYSDFADLSTEYNTVNRINVEYAGLGKSTISPIILKYFLMETMKGKSIDPNPYDIAFSMEYFNQGILQRNFILQYIASKLGVEWKEYSNAEMYKCLVKILKKKT